MIISSRRSLIGTNNTIFLPAWLRAPLSIQDRDTVFATWEIEAGKTYLDISISRFEPRHWGDIWRIEMETIDRIGFYSDIMNFFLDNNLLLLAMEGSVIDGGRSHVMSFILSGVFYSSEHDKTNRIREAADYFVLRDLTETISVLFIDQLLFSDSGIPRLKIRRIDSYHRLRKRLQDNSLRGPETLRFQGQRLRLNDNINNAILAAHPTSSPVTDKKYAMVSADTKDRLGRILAFRDGNHIPLYLQVAVQNDIRYITEVLRVLNQHNCNIIKFQVRKGLSRNNSSPILLASDNQVIRLDLTIVPQRPHYEEKYISHIIASLTSCEPLKSAGCEVLSLENFSK